MAVPEAQSVNDVGLSKRAKEIFVKAVELAPAERTDFVKRAANDDTVLIAEVESWLASYSESEGFIETPAIPFNINKPILPLQGKQFGSYTIVSEIARGGMGAVFLAERSDGEFEQQVALKIIRQTFADPHMIERFRRERQILAALSHPNIARLLDGGVTEDGEPFVVMEYIDGISLIEYAESNGLGLTKRLQLFQKVCSAVAHAHRNLIVHRDIKPGNIIVDHTGEPKLLDFGVAKLLGDDPENAEKTETIFRALTPAYASPEQLSGQSVTTSSDIYSLGVVLYELLTGRRPFDFEGKDLVEIVRTAIETEPLPPSDRIVSSVDHSKLNADLDNIVLYSLRKEPARRYESVDAFSDDINRHLLGLPVKARPSTAFYRASKFVFRHKVGTFAALIVLLSLIAAVVISFRQAQVASRERDIAQQERIRAEQINSFLKTILSAASPEEKGRDARVIEVLDDTAARVDSEFSTEPTLKAQVLFTIGDTYNSLGLPEKAEKYLREALDIELTHYGERNRSTANTMIQLGNCLSNLGKIDESAALLERGVNSEREFSPEGSERLAHGLFVLGETNVRAKRYDQAISELTESIQIFDKIKGKNNPDSAYSYISLGRAYERTGDLDTAESMFRLSIDIYRGLAPKFEYRKALALFNLGNCLMQKSKLDEAISVLNEGYPVFAQMGDSWEHFSGLCYFARVYFQKRDYPKTLDYSRRAIELAGRIKLEATPDYLTSLNYLGLSLIRTGDPASAEPYLRKFYSLSFRDFPDGDIQRAFAQGSLGECFTALRRYAEARPLLEQSYAVIRSVRGENDAITTSAATRLAELNKRSTPAVVK